MGKIASAVVWAVGIANDDSHGYDQNNRWSPDYDCSSLIISAWESVGVPVKKAGASYTGNMVDAFLKCGFEDVTKQVNLSTGSGLKSGDITWKNGHVEMMCSATELVGASISENGTIYADEVGDQTGKEIRVRNYYNPPWSKVLRYMGDSDIKEEDCIVSNNYLSLSEMQINATYIYKYFYSLGWTLNAISGMLGNMQRESTINSGLWQNRDEGNTSLGLGLVQWTPATNLINWANTKGLDYLKISTQCAKIYDEYLNGGQYYETSDYPLSFSEFAISKESPEYLASVFLKNYERAGVEAESERKENARYWYNYLQDLDPTYTPTEPHPMKKYQMSLMMKFLATSRR